MSVVKTLRNDQGQYQGSVGGAGETAPTAMNAPPIADVAPPANEPTADTATGLAGSSQVRAMETALGSDSADGPVNCPQCGEFMNAENGTHICPEKKASPKSLLTESTAEICSDCGLRHEEKVSCYVAEQFEMAKQGVLALQTSEGWQAWLQSLTKFHTYSFRNQMLLMAQANARGIDPSRFASFNTWKANGRFVGKGEKAFHILRPNIHYFPVKDANGKPVLDENGKPKKKQGGTSFSVANTFELSQTEGDPLPEMPYKSLDGDAPEGFRDDLHAAIEAEGYTIVYTDTHAAEGSTNPTTRIVTIRTDASDAHQAAVAAHELGHIKMGHVDVLQRGGKCRGTEEVEAESFARVVCAANGLDTSSNSDAYIGSWLRANPAAMETSANHIRNITNTTLTERKWKNATELKTAVYEKKAATRKPAKKRAPAKRKPVAAK